MEIYAIIIAQINLRKEDYSMDIKDFSFVDLARCK